MNKEELLKAIMKLPKGKPNIPIATMNSINVDDLISSVDRLNKVPDYNDLLKENKKQKEVINKAIDQLVKYQTEWCQEDEVIRDLKKVLDILKEVE